MKMENNELTKICVNNCLCYYVDSIYKKYDKKSYDNNWISYKTWISAKPSNIMFDKVDGFIRDYGGINI